MSLGGARYLIAFLAGKSTFTKVELMQKRSESKEKTRETISWLERQTGVTVKRVHSDRDREYKTIDGFLQSCGIIHTYSPGYMPQSNRIAERFNTTILNKVRAMLNLARLSVSHWHWGEAILHGAHLHNITSSRVYLAKRRMTYCTDLDLIIPGCGYLVFLAFLHVQKEQRKGRLSDRGQPGLLLGHKGCMYRVLCFSTRPVTSTKHVVVGEQKFPGEDYGASEDGKYELEIRELEDDRKEEWPT